MTIVRHHPREIAAPRFTVGQKVHLANVHNSTMTKDATFQITAILPPLGRFFQYRIHDLNELHERIATENNLSPIGIWSSAHKGGF